jgi:hypothetical protein
LKKIRSNSLAIIAIVLILSLISCKKENEKIKESDTQPSDTTQPDTGLIEDNYKKYCDDYAVFFVNTEYMVRNNVWGFNAGSYTINYSQCAFQDSLNSSIFGWEWDLDNTSENPAYPNVEYGWNPWEVQPTTQSIPILLNTLSSILVSFEMEFSAKGYHNIAFDIWLTNSDISNDTTVSVEIMIWLETTLTCGAELIVSNLTINSETYDFYKTTEWSSIPYIAFVNKNSTWSGKLDILPFITYLVENNHISSDDYLSLIEFGNEIWSGAGKMELKNYIIKIE